MIKRLIKPFSKTTIITSTYGGADHILRLIRGIHGPTAEPLITILKCLSVRDADALLGTRTRVLVDHDVYQALLENAWQHIDRLADAANSRFEKG